MQQQIHLNIFYSRIKYLLLSDTYIKIRKPTQKIKVISYRNFITSRNKFLYIFQDYYIFLKIYNLSFFFAKLIAA